MFKKNDPLVDSVRAVMEVSDIDRKIEAVVNEQFGVTSKNALPHELKPAYEKMIAEAKKCMEEGGIMSFQQQMSGGSKPPMPKSDAGSNLTKTGSAPAKPTGPLTQQAPNKPSYMVKEDEKQVDEKVHPSKYSKKQIRLATLGNRTGHGGDPKEIDEPDLRAVRKVGHIEEEEQLNELKAKTLRSYKRKAEHQLDQGKAKGKEYNRQLGVDRADNRLKKRSFGNMKDMHIDPEHAEWHKSKPYYFGEEEQLDEISQKKVIDTLKLHGPEPYGHPKNDAILKHMRKKWGRKSVKNAEKALDTAYWGRGHESDYATENDPLEYSSQREKRFKKSGELDKRSVAGLKQAHRRAIEDMRDKRAPRGVPKAQLPEETQLSEKKLTPAETSKKEELVKKMKGKGFEKRYPGRGEKVMYATATKMAKKLAEENVFEEIRNSLQEQLLAVYESGDEAAFESFVSSLTEEQLEILGLNEFIETETSSLNESVTNNQEKISKSFEHFLRNKFLKG